jgi:hypothetical protein
MRPLCEACEAPMREEASYPAFEGSGEVSVAVWVCTGCGAPTEEATPPPDPGPAADRRVA